MTNVRPVLPAFVFFAVCFFGASLYLATHRSLCETLEAESALVAKAFYQGDSILINELNGKEDLDKPPGFYWLISGLYRIWPEWEAAVRLPSMLSVLFFLAIFWGIAARKGLGGDFAVFWSAMFMCCPKVFWMSQVGRMDMLFSFLCFLAIYFFLETYGGSFQSGKTRTDEPGMDLPAGFYATAGLSIMVKGPLGAVLIFGSVFLFLALEGRFGLVGRILGSRRMLLFLAVWVPWYLYAAFATDFRFVHRFFLEENLSRFTSLIPGGAFKEFNHSPATRYLVYLATGFFPWSFILPAACWKAAANWRASSTLDRFFLVYFLFVFVFFSLATSKRSDYILPLYPAAAFLCSSFLVRSGRMDMRSIAVKFASWLVIFAVFALAVAAACHILGVPGGRPFSWPGLDEKARFILSAVGRNGLPSILLFVLLVIGWWRFVRDNGKRLLQFFLASSALLLLLAGTHILPAVYEGKDVRPFCRKVARIVGDASLFYAGFWDEECTFYLDRRVEKIGLRDAARMISQEGARLFFIVDAKRLGRLERMGAEVPVVFEESGLVLRPLFLLSNLNR